MTYKKAPEIEPNRPEPEKKPSEFPEIHPEKTDPEIQPGQPDREINPEHSPEVTPQEVPQEFPSPDSD